MSGRPTLTPYPLEAALGALAGTHAPACMVTMSVGQWDGLLSMAYDHGWVLLELDDEERPVRAFRIRVSG